MENFIIAHRIVFLLVFACSFSSHAQNQGESASSLEADSEQSKNEEKDVEDEITNAEKLDIGIPEGDESAFDKIVQVNQVETPSILSDDDKRAMNVSVERVMNQSIPVSEQLFEGDMELDKDDLDVLSEKVDVSEVPGVVGTKRNAVVWKKKLWRTREIPYIINHPGTSRDSSRAVRVAIVAALKSIEDKSCLKFRPRSSGDKNWLEYYKGAGCHSGVGRKYYQTAPTRISLGELCINKGLIQHETLHALGFYHEQSRPDRDTYVKVNWENMRTDMQNNFQRHKNYEGDTQGSRYDYKSVMHYSQTAFTVNGKPVLVNKFDPYMPLGGKEMTETDFFELNALYHCRDADQTSWTKWSSWSPCYKTFRGACQKNRQRLCLAKDTSKCPGANEYGVEEILRACQSIQCQVEKVVPGWGTWQSWSKCSLSCGIGERMRRRACNNPSPTSGDKCRGLTSQTRICRYKKCAMSWFDTNFEKGFGMWVQDTKDGFDWSRISGRSPSGNSGPMRDHTTGSGNYIIAISGTGSFRSDMNGKIARLTSYQIPANFGQKCLTFYYQMNGKHVDRLRFYIETKSKSTIFLWSKTGHQGNSWIPGAANLPRLSEPYKIMIEARSGFGTYADIALDDIYIDDGKCLPYANGWQEYNSLYCFLWKGSGQCYKSRKWMLSNCCEACAGLNDCRDSSGSCGKWAKEGWCVAKSWFWKIWMWIKCCNSCKQCTDKSRQCPNWAKLEGECKKDWMLNNCKTSCNVCKA